MPLTSMDDRTLRPKLRQPARLGSRKTFACGIALSHQYIELDDRIEIISPGHLPNNLTVEKIRSGISNIRNPILVSYAAKGLLPYKGLGSGIKRALEDWPDIRFTDDREGCMFIATVHRKELGNAGYVEKSTQKSTQKIIELMQNDPAITIADLALRIGITEWAIKKQIRKMKAKGRIQRIGPDKGGRWQVAK